MGEEAASPGSRVLRLRRWIVRAVVVLTLGLIVTIAHPAHKAFTIGGVGLLPLSLGTPAAVLRVDDADGDRWWVQQSVLSDRRMGSLFVGSTMALDHVHPNTLHWTSPRHQAWAPPVSTGAYDSDALPTVTFSYGWPFGSFACDYSIGDDGGWWDATPLNGITVEGSEPIMTTKGEVARVVPTRLLMRGFVANWAVASGQIGMVYIAIIVWGVRRRAKRLRTWANGVCPYCGYDVTGIDICPECGNAGERPPWLSPGAKICIVTALTITGVLLILGDTPWWSDITTTVPGILGIVMGPIVFACIGGTIAARRLRHDPTERASYLRDWVLAVGWILTLVVVSILMAAGLIVLWTST